MDIKELIESKRLRGERPAVPSREEVAVVVGFFRREIRGVDLGRIYGVSDNAAIIRAALVLRKLVLDGDIVRLHVEDYE